VKEYGKQLSRQGIAGGEYDVIPRNEIIKE
jgi:hypothetical protein